ncbi:MAG: EamA family transporter, partial [Bacteroidales bacterium]|nr:EamA family transporter [Bacteroidales bacterium]
MTDRKQYIGHSSLIACNVIWGAAVPISKFILVSGVISSTVLADIRLIAGTLFFWLASLCIPSERAQKVDRKDYLKLILAAFFSSALLQFLYMKGVSLTSPVDA